MALSPVNPLMMGVSGIPLVIFLDIFIYTVVISRRYVILNITRIWAWVALIRSPVHSLVWYSIVLVILGFPIDSRAL